MWRLLMAGVKTIVATIVATIIAPGAAAQVFECTNAAGVKEYADFCAPGTVQRRQVGKGESGAAAPAAAAPAAKSSELQEAEFRQRTLERQEAQTKAEEEKTKTEEFERNCVEARSQLQAVLDGQRLQRFDPVTSERIQYTDRDRAEAAERLRKAITQWCR